MLEFHGLADEVIKYEGDVRRQACLPAIPHWIQTWAKRDGLSLTNASSSVPGASEGSTAVRYEFGGGLVTHIMDGTVSDRMEQPSVFCAGKKESKICMLTSVRRTSGMTGQPRSQMMITTAMWQLSTHPLSSSTSLQLTRWLRNPQDHQPEESCSLASIAESISVPLTSLVATDI